MLIRLIVLSCLFGLAVSQIEEFADIYVSTAYHIEEDVGNAKQLIVSSFGALHTLKLHENLDLIVGSDYVSYWEGITSYARFNYISGFHQVNTTHIIVVDHRNHCLRLVNRETASTSRFAGRCQYDGFMNGESSKARFRSPTNVISGYYENEYYVTDTGNNAIRSIQVSWENQSVSVSTLVRDDSLMKPQGLALNRINQRLFVSINFDIVKVNLVSKQIEYLQISGLGEIRSMIFLSKDVYLIADLHNRVLRQLDMNNNSTSVTNFKCNNPPVNCDMEGEDAPYSLSLSKNRSMLYIGLKDSVQFLQLPEPVPVDPPPVTIPTPAQNTMTTVSESAATQRPATQVSETTPNASTKIFNSSITQTSTAYASDSSSHKSVGLQGFFSFSDWKGVTVLSLTVVIIAMVITFISHTIVRRRRRSIRRMKSQSSTSSSDNQHQVYEQPITLIKLSSPEEELSWPQNRDLPTPPPTGDTPGASSYELAYNDPVEVINEPPVSIAPLPPNGNIQRRQPSEIRQTENHYEDVNPRYYYDNATDQSHPLLMSEAKNNFSTVQSQRSANTSLSLNFGNP